MNYNMQHESNNAEIRELWMSLLGNTSEIPSLNPEF